MKPLKRGLLNNGALFRGLCLVGLIALGLGCSKSSKQSPGERTQHALSYIGICLGEHFDKHGVLPPTLAELDDQYVDAYGPQVHYRPDGLFKVRRANGAVQHALLVSKNLVEISRKGEKAFLVVTDSLDLVAISNQPTSQGKLVESLPEKLLQGYIPTARDGATSVLQKGQP